MKTKSKALLLTLCAVLLVAASVLGTMAYLTDNDTVTNTFTVGNVKLGSDSEAGLDEAKVNEDGQPLDENDKVLTAGEDGKIDLTKAKRVTSNTYKLVPGHSYTKDPTIHVGSDSEDCYLFVKVENGISAYEAATVTGGYTNIAGQITANGWTALNGVDNVYYKEYTKDDTKVTDYVVFSNFKIADNADTVSGWDSINTTKPTIVINAYAVQKDGFDTAKAAWDATFATTTSGSTTGGNTSTGDTTGDDKTENGGIAGA